MNFIRFADGQLAIMSNDYLKEYTSNISSKLISSIKEINDFETVKILSMYLFDGRIKELLEDGHIETKI